MQADDYQADCDKSLSESDLILATIDVPAVQNSMPKPVVSSTCNVIVSGLSEARISYLSRENDNVCDSMATDVLDLVDNLMRCNQTENRSSPNLITDNISAVKDISANEPLKQSNVDEVQESINQPVRLMPRALPSHSSASATAPTVLEINPIVHVGNTGSTVRVRRGVGRLADRVKLTLKENAKVDTPVRLASVSVSAKDEQVDIVADSVHRFVEREPSTFYGLPLIVKQLLETHRGISSLYRTFLISFII